MPPSLRSESVPLELVAGISIVVVDISASMDDALAEDAAAARLPRLAGRCPSATWLAVDEAFRLEVSGQLAVDLVLALPRHRVNSLARAFQGRDVSRAFVITDDDGNRQLVGFVRAPPKIGIVSRSTINWIDLLSDPFAASAAQPPLSE